MHTYTHTHTHVHIHVHTHTHTCATRSRAEASACLTSSSSTANSRISASHASSPLLKPPPSRSPIASPSQSWQCDCCPRHRHADRPRSPSLLVPPKHRQHPKRQRHRHRHHPAGHRRKLLCCLPCCARHPRPQQRIGAHAPCERPRGLCSDMHRHRRICSLPTVRVGATAPECERAVGGARARQRRVTLVASCCGLRGCAGKREKFVVKGGDTAA